MLVVEKSGMFVDAEGTHDATAYRIAIDSEILTKTMILSAAYSNVAETLRLCIRSAAVAAKAAATGTTSGFNLQDMSDRRDGLDSRRLTIKKTPDSDCFFCYLPIGEEERQAIAILLQFNFDIAGLLNDAVSRLFTQHSESMYRIN